MSNSHALEIRHAHVRLSGTEVLHDVSVSVESQSVHCIIGANGAGKSTLLRVMSGDVANHAAFIHDKAMSAVDTKELARFRAVLRPLATPLFPFTVEQFVGMCDVNNTAQLTPDRVVEVLGQCELTTLAERPITQLSSGQRARVHLACALIQDTDVVIADEPEATLDPVARISMWALLASSKRTLVIATHSLNLVRHYATHVTALRDGRVLYSKPIDQVAESELMLAYG